MNQDQVVKYSEARFSFHDVEINATDFAIDLPHQEAAPCSFTGKVTTAASIEMSPGFLGATRRVAAQVSQPGREASGSRPRTD